MRARSRLGALLLGLALTPPLAVGSAQDSAVPAATRRALTDPAHEAPALESVELVGAPAPPDPMLEAHVAFHAGLDAIPIDRARTLRLEAARRVAPMDLVWGLDD